MPQNAFDKASRFAAKLDPHAFFAWATGLPAEKLAFRGWLDTRGLPFPGDPDRVSDTVARVEDPSVVQVPWMIAVEFQIEPDALMFGRLMVYLGQLWQTVKSDPNRGSRFNLGAMVFNLTGTGDASRDMRWPEAGFGTQLAVVERNLASEDADTLLAGIEGGKWSRGVLPWLPLMTRGDDSGIIDRWKKLAEAEPDFRRKADLANLARVFATAADRRLIWDKALEGWNVKESSVVNEWIAEGRVAATVASVVAVLEARFGQLPPELEAAIRGCADLVKLQSWITHAAKATTLDEFRAAAGI